MIEQRIIISGFGGQGVLLLGKLLALAGMREGLEVSWLPSYGPEMRGGTANCHVILSEQPIGAPIVSEASAVIAMNLPSLERFEGNLLPRGLMIYNSSMTTKGPSRGDIRSLGVPANELALAEGGLKVANVVLLGAFLELAGIPSQASITAVLEHTLGPERRHLLDINLKALESGRRQAVAQLAQPLPH